jgi:DNA repair protein SbcC/Rad50
MFDFFFKRSSRRAAAPAVPVQQPAADRPDAGLAKRAALEQAAGFANDEAGAAAFIEKCPIADARLAAAEHIHAQAMLERALKAVRNTDRRVAKLMQSRLDALQRRRRDAERAAQCLRQAEQLAQQPVLIANQVAELDRDWSAVAEIPDAERAAFDSMREQLRVRLEAQAGLQRAVRDAVARLRALAGDAQSSAADDVAIVLDRLNGEMSQLLASAQAAALPPQLAEEFRQHEADLRRQLAGLAERDNAMRARDAALSEWEQSAPDALNKAELVRAWRALPALSGDAATPFEQRLAQLLAAADAAQRPPAPSKPAKDAAPVDRKPFDDKQFGEVLGQLEQALQDGSLQTAAEADRVLRSFDSQAARIAAAPAARLSAARAELHRLQAWARWGGNISREELLKAAQALPASDLPAPELAKRIGSLRARWKSLDVSAGPAHRDIWERFDAACSAAYAPAAAYFEQRALERANTLQVGRQLIEEVRSLAGSLDSREGAAAPDWKAIAQSCQRMQQAWRQLGPIDRKEKKALDRDFDAAMQLLNEPLAAERRAEVTRREQLIDEVESIDMQQRNATDAVRAVQERWQLQSRTLPLERRDEQALWQRFRAACDAAFAVRKQAAVIADKERDAHLQQKEALCAQLEQAETSTERETSQLLRDVKTAWDRIGHVPRATEQSIEKRFAAAQAHAQRRLDRMRDAAADAERAAVRIKLERCLALEAAIASDAPPPADAAAGMRAEWEAATPLPPAWEKPLRQRFDAAIDALTRGDRAYAGKLRDNGARMCELLLKSEIVLGVDSPAELSRERLQLQVQVLQSSLKAGREDAAPAALLRQLLATPAAADAAAVARLMRVVGSMRVDAH